MSETWHEICAVDAFPDTGKHAAAVGDWRVLVIRTATGFSAFNDRCTHQAAMLSPGKVRREAIMCPLHGARFEVATGRCIGGTYADLRKFDLRVEGGQIEVLLPDSPPGPQDRAIAG